MEHVLFWVPVSLAALLVWVKRDRALEDLRFVGEVLRGRRPVAPPRGGSPADVSSNGTARGHHYAAWTAAAVPTDDPARQETRGAARRH